MGTTAISHTMQELLQRQEAFFRRIPGISALRHAAPESISELETKYPDAAFALMISDNLFVGDRELNEIHQKAYTAILRGESIPGVRFRYDYDTESYLRRHMWDLYLLQKAKKPLWSPLGFHNGLNSFPWTVLQIALWL